MVVEGKAIDASEHGVVIGLGVMGSEVVQTLALDDGAGGNGEGGGDGFR